MAKSFTHYDSARLSQKSSKVNTSPKEERLQPSAKALRFVLDYARSSTVIKSKSLKSIILLNN